MRPVPDYSGGSPHPPRWFDPVAIPGRGGDDRRMQKRTYAPPVVNVVGTVAQVTLARDNTGLVDANYVGQPLPPGFAS